MKTMAANDDDETLNLSSNEAHVNSEDKRNEKADSHQLDLPTESIVPSNKKKFNNGPSSKQRWWDVLVRSAGGERQLALKSVTALAALITAIIWMSYKYYWKSSREGRHNNEQTKKRRSKTNGIASNVIWWWWLRSRQSNRNNNNHIAVPPRGSSTQVVPLSTLLQAAKSGSVERALFRASQIWFQTKGNNKNATNQWQTTHLPAANQYNSQQLQSDLFDLLQRSGATISALPDSIWQKLATPALAALPFVYLALLYRMMHKLQHPGDNDMKRASTTNAKSLTSFADVAGLDHVITEVSEVVQYLHHPKAYHGVGARPPRAILLHGPPGSGKTLLARAVAGEAHTFFYACSASEFVETYVGRGAARVRSVFAKARTEAKKLQGQQQRRRQVRHHGIDTAATATAILFIDELDALAKTRSSGLLASSNDERDQTLNQLLTEMDGFHNQDDDDDDVTIIVIAATNRADVLDPAILRRFDRQVYVGYPDATGREAILKVHAKKIKCGDTTGDIHHRIRWDWLASDDMTPNFSGADLRNVINEAALLAVRDHSVTVQEQHLILAVERLREMKKHLQAPHHISRQFLPPFSLENLS